MKGKLTRASGYQDDHMHLPVAGLDSAIPFYEAVLGFHVVARADLPHRSAVLERDGIQIGLTENGGDSSQDGCAFHVTDVAALFAEFQANGLNKDAAAFEVEDHGEVSYKVFYVVAPDGLCFWFGEPAPSV